MNAVVFVCFLISCPYYPPTFRHTAVNYHNFTQNTYTYNKNNIISTFCQHCTIICTPSQLMPNRLNVSFSCAILPCYNIWCSLLTSEINPCKILYFFLLIFELLFVFAPSKNHALAGKPWSHSLINIVKNEPRSVWVCDVTPFVWAFILFHSIRVNRCHLRLLVCMLSILWRANYV